MWHHVKLSEQFRPWDVKQPTNQPAPPAGPPIVSFPHSSFLLAASAVIIIIMMMMMMMMMLTMIIIIIIIIIIMSEEWREFIVKSTVVPQRSARPQDR